MEAWHQIFAEAWYEIDLAMIRGQTSVIIGVKRPDQLADNLGAACLFLSADELAALDKTSALPAEYPGWMFAVQGQCRRDQVNQAKRGNDR